MVNEGDYQSSTKVSVYGEILLILSIKKGGGQALMKRIGDDIRQRTLAKSKDNPGKKVVGFVDLDSVNRESLIAWYEKLGFKRTGSLSGTGEVSMSRDVSEIDENGKESFQPLVRY